MLPPAEKLHLSQFIPTFETDESSLSRVACFRFSSKVVYEENGETAAVAHLRITEGSRQQFCKFFMTLRIGEMHA